MLEALLAALVTDEGGARLLEVAIESMPIIEMGLALLRCPYVVASPLTSSPPARSRPRPRSRPRGCHTMCIVLAATRKCACWL